MESFSSFLDSASGVVWGPLTMILLLGTGIYMMLGLRALPLRKVGYGFKMLFAGRKSTESGEISPFNALMTALSATIGTGNIAGVATAIFLGGPGALFWMWCTALVGMATKFSETVLSLTYREKDEKGEFVGGPMYYIRKGLGAKFAWLAVLFAFFGAFAAFGIGNTVQANAMAQALESAFGIDKIITAVVLTIAVFIVLIGGIKRIAEVAGKIVPLMAVSYFIAGIAVLATNFSEIPAAISLVVESAFTPVAATGGFAGAGIMLAIQMGVARGIFSNEAGLGSAPIAHAAAQTNEPVRQGVIAMLGTFIDTIVVCSITGLAIVVTGVWSSGDTGAVLTSAAFSSSLALGDEIIALGLIVFAFTTILGWSYYGERCAQYLLGTRVVLPYRLLFVLAVPVGALMQLDLVWKMADVLNGLMAIPNLIAILLLSPVVFKAAKTYFEKH
ncbi:MAG: sodium:alanine symporter family protein [Gammaproteobacteria bacterium]|nr:sodium:alanine symporter family protein [Gammaproteobacteria bacterium]